jgi:hypothetical protein
LNWGQGLIDTQQPKNDCPGYYKVVEFSKSGCELSVPFFSEIDKKYEKFYELPVHNKIYNQLYACVCAI